MFSRGPQYDGSVDGRSPVRKRAQDCSRNGRVRSDVHILYLPVTVTIRYFCSNSSLFVIRQRPGGLMEGYLEFKAVTMLPEIS